MKAERTEVARRLVQWHFEVEPDLEEVYVFMGEAGDPIRLLEVNPATVPSEHFEAFSFAPTKDVPFLTAIAEVTREEFERLRARPGSLPKGWDLESATLLRRPKAA